MIKQYDENEIETIFKEIATRKESPATMIELIKEYPADIFNTLTLRRIGPKPLRQVREQLNQNPWYNDAVAQILVKHIDNILSLYIKRNDRAKA